MSMSWQVISKALYQGAQWLQETKIKGVKGGEGSGQASIAPAFAHGDIYTTL